jgi:hypothetical protein
MGKKPGPKKKRNPIGEHLQKLIETKGLTREEIAVATGIGYLTLLNVFNRDKVSDRLRIRLKMVGLIDDSIIEEYKKWCKTKGLDLR